MPDATNGTNAATGKIVEIKGVVIDVVFSGELPEIYSALRIDVPAQEGQEARSLIAEVQQHLGDDRIRAVAMDSTDGLARGLAVEDTGGPISVPVGDVTLGRISEIPLLAYRSIFDAQSNLRIDAAARSCAVSTAAIPMLVVTVRGPASVITG